MKLGPTTWITHCAAISPAVVQPACPVASPCGKRRLQSSRTAGPPARWMAPSTPPPPRIARLAALTTASTSWTVMSPCTAVSLIRPSAGVRGRCRAHRPRSRPGWTTSARAGRWNRCHRSTTSRTSLLLAGVGDGARRRAGRRARRRGGWRRCERRVEDPEERGRQGDLAYGAVHALAVDPDPCRSGRPRCPRPGAGAAAGRPPPAGTRAGCRPRRTRVHARSGAARRASSAASVAYSAHPADRLQPVGPGACSAGPARGRPRHRRCSW